MEVVTNKTIYLSIDLQNIQKAKITERIQRMLGGGGILGIGGGFENCKEVEQR